MLVAGPGARHNALHVRAMRQVVLADNPQAYLLGEHFIEATRWLQGDQEDGAMNHHGFTTPVRAWHAGLGLGGRRALLPTDAFAAALGSAIARIPYANQLAQMNQLDSHDTPRLLTELGGASAQGLARLGAGPHAAVRAPGCALHLSRRRNRPARRPRPRPRPRQPALFRLGPQPLVAADLATRARAGGTAPIST